MLSSVSLCHFLSGFNGRKELGDKETYQGNNTKLFHSVKVNKIDPSRVIELSWQPRSVNWVYLYCFLAVYCNHTFITKCPIILSAEEKQNQILFPIKFAS